MQAGSTRKLGPLSGWALSMLLAVFAVAPLTYPGFFEADSGFLPAFNAAHLDQAPNWGRVADALRGEGRLPYLLAWPFVAASGSGVAGIRWGYALAFLCGAWGTYAWLRHRLGGPGAVLGAAVYTYLPWHLATVYARGAYGEAWLWALWPWLLWAIDRLAERRPRSILAGVAVGLPVLVMAACTQFGLAALSYPILLAYGVLVLSRPRHRAASVLVVLALQPILLPGLSQGAAPAPVPFEQHFLYPFQVLSPGPSWGAGPSGPEPIPGLGLAAVGLSLLALVLGFTSRERGSAEPRAPDLAPGGLGFWLAVLLLVVLLSLSPSAPLWRFGGLHGLLTYPWQVLALAGLPLAFLAGALPALEPRLASLPAWGGLLALVLLASYGYLAPSFVDPDPGPEPLAAFQPAGAPSPEILLLEHEIVPPTSITPTLTLTLTWQAVRPVDADWTLFVHVLSPAGDRVAQRDGQPCGGACPTSAWLPGHLVVDTLPIPIPPDTPPGPYRLALGLYLLDSGERAAIAGRPDDVVVLNVP